MGVEIDYTYQLPGTYEITLTVTGETDSKFDISIIEVKPSLELISSHTISVDEPSGLTFGLNNETLWTVSDRTGQIYQIDLQGNLLQTLPYLGNDLEGISFDVRDSSFWIVDESSASLVHLDSSGIEMKTQWIAGVSEGGGLEGVSVDPIHSRIFLLKEKNNSALVILNDSLATTLYERIGFAPDYSGMCYSTASDQLWLLSHEASSLYLTDTLGHLINSYGVFLDQPEGLVYDDIDSVFYIVDDTIEKLYKFQFWN